MGKRNAVVNNLGKTKMTSELGKKAGGKGGYVKAIEKKLQDAVLTHK